MPASMSSCAHGCDGARGATAASTRGSYDACWSQHTCTGDTCSLASHAIGAQLQPQTCACASLLRIMVWCAYPSCSDYKEDEMLTRCATCHKVDTQHAHAHTQTLAQNTGTVTAHTQTHRHAQSTYTHRHRHMHTSRSHTKQTQIRTEHEMCKNMLQHTCICTCMACVMGDVPYV